MKVGFLGARVTPISAQEVTTPHCEASTYTESHYIENHTISLLEEYRLSRNLYKLICHVSIQSGDNFCIDHVTTRPAIASTSSGQPPQDHGSEHAPYIAVINPNSSTAT